MLSRHFVSGNNSWKIETEVNIFYMAICDAVNLLIGAVFLSYHGW